MKKRFKDVEGCKYDLDNVPLNLKMAKLSKDGHLDMDTDREALEKGELTLWSGKAIPAIGDKVEINFNHLGTGVVESYFVENGWLGVCVVLDAVTTNFLIRFIIVNIFLWFCIWGPTVFGINMNYLTPNERLDMVFIMISLLICLAIDIRRYFNFN